MTCDGLLFCVLVDTSIKVFSREEVWVGGGLHV